MAMSIVFDLAYLVYAIIQGFDISLGNSLFEFRLDFVTHMNRTFLWCVHYRGDIPIGGYMELTIKVPNALKAIRVAFS